ncbi:hypothetical protein D9M72_260370 [compost metagenome]
MDTAGEFGDAHRVSHALERGRQGLQRRALLELGFLVAAAHVGQGDGRLDVQAPVQHAHQGLGHVIDDGAAAGRPHQQIGPVAAQHDHRRHRAARTLAGLDAVGHEPAFGVPVRRRKIRHLVIQQKAAHEDLAAEFAFDGGGHAQRIALGVHRHQVARGRQFKRIVLAQRQELALGIARQRHLHAAVRADQRAPRAQVGGIQQGAHRHRHESRVGHVEVAVGERQPAGLGKIMHRLHAARRIAADGELLEFAQHLQHGDGAAAGRAHAAKPVAAVAAADGRTFLGAVGGQVGQAQVAGHGVAMHRGDDVPGDAALVERVRAAFRHRAQGAREFRVLQHVANRPGRAAGRVEIGRRRGLRGQRLVAGQQRVQARRHGEALLRQPDRGLEQVGPGQRAVLFVRQLQSAQQAGHADRHAVVDGLRERQRFALGIQEAVLAGRGGRGLAAVVGLDAAGPGRIQHHERAAADARGLRLHQVQHHLGRDGGVHYAAAPAQHFVAGLRRQRIGRHHHEMRGPRQLTVPRAAGGLRVEVLGRLGRPRPGGGQGAHDGHGGGKQDGGGMTGCAHERLRCAPAFRQASIISTHPGGASGIESRFPSTVPVVPCACATSRFSKRSAVPDP